MRILVIGGTQLSGPYLVRELAHRGHRVTLYHRGVHKIEMPAGVDRVLAPSEKGPPDDRYFLRALADQARRLKPDVVVHMIAFTREDGEVLVAAFKGIAGRTVVASSSDVYRAMGIINRTESGPPIPVPISEGAALREKLSPHGIAYEKRWVEQAVCAEPSLPATLLRFPAVYGPGSYRRQDWVKRMLDGRPAIILGKGEAMFRFSHGYARDVGHATALAVMDDRAAGRVYNVGERIVPIERRRLEDFARIAGWRGRVVELPDESVPTGDGLPYHGQDWLLDTSRIRSELGFDEVSDYEHGIRQTIEWQRKHPNPKLEPNDFNYAMEDRLLGL